MLEERCNSSSGKNRDVKLFIYAHPSDDAAAAAAAEAAINKTLDTFNP